MAELDFEKLQQEHRSLDQRIREMEHRIHLTPEEQIELPRLKKLRLATKDRLLMLARPRP